MALFWVFLASSAYPSSAGSYYFCSMRSSRYPFGLNLSKPGRASWESMLGFRAGAGSRPAGE
ncbi:MAG: DUF1010 domain-containing protein [Acidovorax sp.]|uniref:DUF1010 domain-containing protein n=1 Tax=Acidovorax sp. TaxID=1872122 RepID=UPI003918E2DA